jgi:hypothetical protein
LWQDEPPSFLLPSLLCDCNMLHIWMRAMFPKKSRVE